MTISQITSISQYYYYYQDQGKKEKRKLFEKIQLNTKLIDLKTQLLDENATLEKRKMKDKVTLEKVNLLRSLHFVKYQTIK